MRIRLTLGRKAKSNSSATTQSYLPEVTEWVDEDVRGRGSCPAGKKDKKSYRSAFTREFKLQANLHIQSQRHTVGIRVGV